MCQFCVGVFFAGFFFFFAAAEIVAARVKLEGTR